MQESDWTDRPLSKQQIEYAAHDSHFLIHVCQQILEETDKQEIDKIFQ
jgi:ribonuclease D